MSFRLLAICLFFCTGSATAATADNYAYAWPLQTSGDSAAWQVELNAEVYAAARDASLRDIEVVNATGDAVPMAPRGADERGDFERSRAAAVRATSARIARK